MSDEVKVLGQQPIKVKIGGQEVMIYPPSPARALHIGDMILKEAVPVLGAKVDEIKKLAVEYADKPEADAKVTAAVSSLVHGLAPQLVKVAQEICRERGRDGKIPAPFDSADFWMQEVTTSEIAQLLGVFIQMLDISSMLKNAQALRGIVV